MWRIYYLCTRLPEIFYEPDCDIVRLECHPSLQYFMVGDTKGFIRLWKMKGTLDSWDMVYERQLDGVISSTLWVPLECEVNYIVCIVFL